MSEDPFVNQIMEIINKQVEKNSDLWRSKLEYCQGEREAYRQGWEEEKKKTEQLQAENERLKGLLGAANCPNCNGDGAYYDNYGNVCQCQWCYEKDEALKETEP